MVKSRFDDFKKSTRDKRSYRGLVLDNELKVLLVSDPETDTAAAALAVNIGYYSDPWELSGLAHFLEHMLFLGTEKYPEEIEYRKYLSEHGGSSNGYTSAEHTHFYLNIDPGYLNGALDRLSQFFIAPSFTEDATDREVWAVHSEFETNNSISRCMHMLERSTSKPGHPFTKFGTGNLHTLDINPKAEDINVREKLLEFHNTWYSSNIMSLAILGKESLDELQEVTENIFGDIINKNVTLPEWPGHPFGPEQLGKKLLVVPNSDMCDLTIIFPICDVSKNYKSDPAYYLANLVGHDGKGSLFSALKRRGWCTYLEAGPSYEGRGMYFFFVRATLTEDGIQHTDDVVDFIFQYINMLKEEEPKEWIFQEFMEILNIKSHYKTEMHPTALVCSAIFDLLVLPIEAVWPANNRMTQWDPELITKVLGYLKPDNCRITILSKKYESVADETEKWYYTKYKQEEISPELMRKWQDSVPSTELQFPAKNEFIPSSLELFPKDDNAPIHPIVFYESALIRAWFKQDDIFLVPEANIMLDFVIPIISLDPLKTNLTHIYVMMLKNELTEYLYDASLVNLSCKVTLPSSSLQLAISGFNDKQYFFLEKVLEAMLNLKIDPKQFEICRESLINDFKNTQNPHRLPYFLENACLTEFQWVNSDFLEAAEFLTVERLEAFIPQLFSILHVESLVYGNVDKESALKLVNLVEKKLAGTQPLKPPHLLRAREICLEDGCNYVYEVSRNARSSCIQVYLQVPRQPRDIRLSAMLFLFVHIAKEPCYNNLRTKDQLGYIVSLSSAFGHSSQGVRVLVQSNLHPVLLDEYIERFLLSMHSYIAEMTNDVFENHRRAMSSQLLIKSDQMSAEAEILWAGISKHMYDFDRGARYAACMLTISKEEVLKFYQDYICMEAPHRRKFAVHVVSAHKPIVLDGVSQLALKPVTKVEDIISFKCDHGYFPLVPPYNSNGNN